MYSNGSFLAGCIVRIKKLDDILKTLEKNDTLEGLPFMPEMVKFCGNIYKIKQRVSKTCMEDLQFGYEELNFGYGIFNNDDVVVLSDLRCDGQFHEGCCRDCTFFWKTKWLELVDENEMKENKNYDFQFEEAHIFNTMQGEGIYFCQNTEMRNSTTPISKIGKIRILLVDLKRKNYSLSDTIKNVFNPYYVRIKEKIRFTLTPITRKSTPSESLNLQPGEQVEVKSYKEILKTLDKNGKNRGLQFTADMTKNCGKRFVVRSRLDKMIDGSTGKMIILNNTVKLQGLTCGCHYPFGGCPKKEFNLWREIWLKRI